MNQHATYIKQRLSLRDPLKDSLDIVAQLAERLSLQKEPDLKAELEKVKSLFPTCTDFERDFPSLCFSIATGVGKTRLMGACITYLYLEKGIRNFFVLAPNLTIYEKLIRDFGDPGYEKYVFRGIAEFVHHRPQIITGDNYAQSGGLFQKQEVRINIFNVSKFNRDAGKPKGKEKGMLPRIKRLSEYLGQSYWEYLSGLEDLVMLMDEAHRYHADSSKAAINELKPVLGIELTATPLDEKGNPFKNVVYEYSLAKAIADGKYVKNPAIAKRKNFRAQGKTQKEIDDMKLEDAISIHQDTKNELEAYAQNQGVKKVKPFILVVCRDIHHASEVYHYLNSTSFYGGSYIGKVLQIDSSTKKEEEIERQFVALEQYDNEIEIVIHVNMLKEGWDVSNLYTIVPLRAANASVLIEQTIGRGLRLPYNGQRTGVDKLDKLTVVAHDNFDKVIAEAQNPHSVLNKLTYIEIEEAELKATTEAVQSTSVIDAEVKKEEKRIEAITNEKEKQQAKNQLDARKAIVNVLPTFHPGSGVTKLDDFYKPEVRQQVLAEIKKGHSVGQQSLFAAQMLKEAEAIYDTVVASFQQHTIEIPRMDLVQDEVRVWFEDFDLDTSKGFDLELLNEEIMVVELTGERKTDSIGVQHGAFTRQSPVNQIISHLINYPEIDYDSNAGLLHKLATQAVQYAESKLPDPTQLPLLIRQYQKIVAERIYQQMKAHFHISEPQYRAPRVLPFVKIEAWNFTTHKDGRRHFTDVISPVSLIPKLSFSGFTKACHFEYKFDSKTEKDFAQLLEADTAILKWLRPAPNQFRIYWAHNAKQYYPDFIVETPGAIFMVETKAADQLQSAEVQDKKQAALKYCHYATQYTQSIGGKPWHYLLVPHHEVTTTHSFQYYVSLFK